MTDDNTDNGEETASKNDRTDGIGFVVDDHQQIDKNKCGDKRSSKVSEGIMDGNGNTIFQCHAFNGGCPETVTINNLAPGSYWVNARVVDSDWTTVLCEAAVDPVVGNAPRVGNPNNGIKLNNAKLAPASFGLYPNPAQEEVNISLNDYLQRNVEIQVIDQLGNVMKSVKIQNVSNTHTTIPLNAIQSGIYYVRILSDGLKPSGKKMIVNKMF